LKKICFYCGEEINEKDLYWSEPIEGAYPSRYGNLFFHKEKCYRKINNIHRYIKDNTEKILETLTNSNPQIPKRLDSKIPINKKEVKKNEKIKTEKTKSKHYSKRKR